MTSDEYPHGCFMQVVEVAEFDNHSLLGEGLGGRIRSPCLKGGGG